MIVAMRLEDVQTTRGTSHGVPRVCNNHFFDAPSRNRTENLLIKSQLL